MLTVDEVREWVFRIEEMVFDPEEAHEAEDSLWCRVLMEIADSGTAHPRELAKAALKTKQISFPRWRA